MRRITILYFAVLRDLTQQNEERLALPESVSTVGELIRHLQDTRPELSGRFASLRIAINESFVTLEHCLESEDVVALIPPVAGG